MSINPRTADIIIESLRAGEVPQEGLEHYATGIDAQVAAFEQELERITDRRGRYRFLRGEYGAGKTFFLRFLAARARAKNYAAAYVRVSYPEVPLHKPAAIYQQVAASLGLGSKPDGALRDLLEHWLFEVSERVVDPDLGRGITDDDPAFPDAVAAEVRTMLGPIADAAPAMAQALAGYARATLAGEHDVARGLLQWLSGDEKVAASAKRTAHLIGKVGQLDALAMLRGLAQLVRQCGYSGLVILIDEVERLVKVPRTDMRQAGLQTLQNWMGALDAGQLPGVLVVVAGTTSFYDSPRGVPLLEPLEQRIGRLDDGPFPDMDAIQLRLPAFDRQRLERVGLQVRDIYTTLHPELEARASDELVAHLAGALAQAFGGKVEVTPRRFLRELIGVLGRLRQHDAYDPFVHYSFDSSGGDLPMDIQERAILEGQDLRAVEEAELPMELDL